MSRVARVAIAQAEVASDLQAGLKETERLVREAAAEGAELVVFPETWLPGYPAWLDVCGDAALWDHAPAKTVFERHAANAVDVAGADGTTLARIARESAVVLVIGIVERVAAGRGRGTLYSSLLTYGLDGRLLNHHRKLMPTHTERLVWGQGDTRGLRAVDTGAGRIGGLVCWEHWMPLTRQALHDSGEDIHVAAWPTVHEMHQVASRHYAFEGRCYVLAAGSIMRASALPPELTPHPSKIEGPGDFVLRGGSAIFAPDGSYVAGPVYDEPAILYGDIDIGAVRREQMTLDVSGHYSRADCFDFSVRPYNR